MIYIFNIYIIYVPHFFFCIFPLSSLFYTNNTFPTHYIVPDWRKFFGARCVFVYTTELRYTKTILLFPIFLFVCLGKPHDRRMKNWGKGGKNSELVFPSKPTLATCTNAFYAFSFFLYAFLLLQEVLFLALFVNKKLNLLRLKCLLQCFIVSKNEKSETLSLLQCFIVHAFFLLFASPFFYPKFATKKKMKISHEKNLKDKAIILRISSSQKALWKKYCAEKKMSLTDFIVSAVENKMSAQERREVLKFIEKQDNIFAKIENNINQFANIANAKKDINSFEMKSFTEQLVKIQELKAVQNQIFKDIYKLIAYDS